MSCPDRPQLRASITGHVDPEDSRFVWLYDSARITRQVVRLRREAVGILELFNGANTLREIQWMVMRQMDGQLLAADVLRDLAARLDEALFLDSPRLTQHYADFLASPIREPVCIGSYEENPTALQQQLRGLFMDEKGPGALVCPPTRQLAMEKAGKSPLPKQTAEIRGALIPHIDFHRGGPTFAWGFKELIENSDADVFVIIGTSHYGRKRYTLTRKDFRTPLGVAETDADYVNRIADEYADGVFEDEAAHLPEHSIEFQVVFLQYCLGNHRPFRIVPLLVGSFQDCIMDETPPHEREDIARMIRALKKTEAASGEKVCYISSGDLAHIGPKFGDPFPVDPPQLEHSRRQDHALLQEVEAADRNGFFRRLADEKDERRICGFPPTYTLMAALEPTRGKLLHYDQYVDPQGQESVSFASLAFYK